MNRNRLIILSSAIGIPLAIGGFLFFKNREPNVNDLLADRSNHASELNSDMQTQIAEGNNELATAQVLETSAFGKIYPAQTLMGGLLPFLPTTTETPSPTETRPSLPPAPTFTTTPNVQ